LELTADLVLEEYEPKLKTEWERSPERQREEIDAFAKRLKAQGVRAVRGKAEKMVARLHGVTVHALRQRRYRPRRPKV
jgi:S-adenosylmethionine:diacylglycerol 3-amino-3-carboxypropyl transferase